MAEYQELVTSNIKYTKEQAEVIAKEEVFKSILKTIPKESEIINSEYKVFQGDNEIIVRVIVECMENIGIKETITF